MKSKRPRLRTIGVPLPQELVSTAEAIAADEEARTGDHVPLARVLRRAIAAGLGGVPTNPKVSY